MGLEKIGRYWSAQAEGYSQINREELEERQRNIWFQLIEEHRPVGECLKVLDMGCGPGFFSILMAEHGHQVVSADYSDGMLNCALENAKKYGVADGIVFRKMDAQNLEFEDNSFDLVLSRNITWTLEHPEKAYREWLRVLRKGGCFLNFDANWRLHLYDEKLAELLQRDKKRLLEMGYEIEEDGHGKKYAGDCLDYLPLSDKYRPLWDMTALLDLGCSNVQVLTKLPNHIMNEYYSILYTHMPMFMVKAKKG